MKSACLFTAAALILLSFACNSNSEENNDSKTTETPVNPETSAPASFSPYMVMLIQHRVGDFNKWLTDFNGHEAKRKDNGLSLLTLARGVDDSNMVYIRLKADDRQKAIDFPFLDDTKETMKKSGVSGPPMIYYMNVVRDEKPSTDLKERVIVSHHVKDFDVWLNAFDAKGKQVREANALIDRTIARDLGDPNVVYIVFDVIDHEKAKSRISSSEVKTFMAEAGVDGNLEVHFYRLVN